MLTRAEIIAEAKCCLATRQASYVNNVWNGIPNECKLLENILLEAYIETMDGFIPIGSVLTEAQIATATFDLSAIGLPANIVGEVTVGVTSLGTVSSNYTTLLQLLNDLAAAVNANTGTTGYSATYTSTQLIIHAPAGSGSALNGTLVTISIDAYFYVQNSLEIGEVNPDDTVSVVCVNNPDSIMYGYTFIAARISGLIYVYNNIALVTIITMTGMNPNSLCYSTIDDAVYVACANAVVPIQKIPAAINPVLGIPLAVATVQCTGIVYNTFNDCKYGIRLGSNEILKIDNTDTVIASIGMFSPKSIGINEANGEMWVSSLGATNIFIVNPTTNIIFPTIVLFTGTEAGFSYYPGTDEPACMLVTNNVSGDIETWDLTTYTQINPSFIAPTNLSVVYYSNFFDKIFVGTGGAGIAIQAYNNDGTPHTVPVVGVSNTTQEYCDNVKYEVVARIAYIADIDQPNVNFVALEPNFANLTAPLLDGTPQILAAAKDNCIDADQDQDIQSAIKKLCDGICGCSDTDTPAPSNPSTPTYVIYYGRNAATSLTGGQIQALGTVSQPNFAGTFDYVASVGTYVFFAYPSLLGTPSRFHDLIGGLDVVMDTPTTVSVLGENYTVYRSFNVLGGAQSMEVQQ